MRKSKILLLESIKRGVMPLTALSFETGNYIRVPNTENYKLMNKDVVFSYQELMKITENECFEILNPLFSTDCRKFPFCITITTK